MSKTRERFREAWAHLEAARIRRLDTTKLADECHRAAGDMFAADEFDPRREVAIRALAVARASFAAAWPYLCDAWEGDASDSARDEGHAIEMAFARLERALRPVREPLGNRHLAAYPAPMPISQDIQSLITRFAADVEALVRTAAVSAVQDALGGAVVHSVAIATKPARKRATAAAKPAAKAKAARSAVARATRVRRSAEDIEATAAKIVDYVRSNPGSKAEQIKSALSLPANQWGAPVRVALESKRLASSGSKRATVYRVPGGAVPPVNRAAK